MANNGFFKVECHKKSKCERPFDTISLHICSYDGTKDEAIYHLTPDEAGEIAIKLMSAAHRYLTRHNKEYKTKFINPRTSVKAIKKSIQKGKL